MKKFLIVLVVASCFIGYSFFSSQRVRSANLTNVTATLSNPRLSFSGIVASSTTVNSVVTVTLDSTPNEWASTSSGQLSSHDTVLIGAGGTANTYGVNNIIAPNKFTLDETAFTGADGTAGDIVVATESGSLTVKLTTATAIANGKIQILVPAAGVLANARDGLPDQAGFDALYNDSLATVTCPTSAPAEYGTFTDALESSLVTIGSQSYHAFTCSYTGAGQSGTNFDDGTYDAFTVNNLVNPAPKTNHIFGYGNAHKIVVRHLDAADEVIDTTTVNVAVIDAVRVTASVPLQITFRVMGVGSAVNACGAAIPTTVATTGNSVPFGDLEIETFTRAAQALSVSTNSTGGYVVTSIATDQLGLNGGACAGDPNPANPGDCIADSRGNDPSGNPMTHTAEQLWSNAAQTGLAYTLYDVNATTTEVFNYATNGVNTCDGSGHCYRQFADEEAGQSPQLIFSDNTTAANDNLYVCYKISVNATQTAGQYENYVKYRATATF